jgi:ubiquinone/menaquinone biosynthesis C-methylase UbiE
MDSTPAVNSDQTKLWNGPASRGWVEAQQLLDRIFKPFEDLLIDAVAARSRLRVLDVGCGTGATTLAAARLPGIAGGVLGLDISAPMIAAAQGRAEREQLPARFICADAQSYAFEAASFDMIISRFGIMFFDDPVGAFQNLRRAAQDGAELRLIAWRSAVDNPFMTTAERAAAPLLPNLPARRPEAPGQFAFANGERVRSILTQSGWKEIEVRPIDIACELPEHELTLYLTRLGPVSLALQDADERTRTEVVETVRRAFDGYVYGDSVRFTAACWSIDARAGALRE